MVLLCPYPSVIPCAHLQFVHPGPSSEAAGGMETVLSSPCCFSSETPIQKLLNGSGYAETLETVLM